MLERPRMRPLFKLALAIPAARLMAEIDERVRAPSSRFAGTVLKRHVELTLREEHRHFWSPHLSLDVLEAPEGVSLRGRYAPHPSIWTFVMAVYGVLGMLALSGTVFGLSQWNLGWTPWALLALPASFVGAALTWLASAFGQRLAEAQMHELQAFFEECVRHASEPPPGEAAAPQA